MYLSNISTIYAQLIKSEKIILRERLSQILNILKEFESLCNDFYIYESNHYGEGRAILPLSQLLNFYLSAVRILIQPTISNLPFMLKKRLPTGKIPMQGILFRALTRAFQKFRGKGNKRIN